MSSCLTDAQADAIASGLAATPAQQQHLLQCATCRAALLRAMQAVTAADASEGPSSADGDSGLFTLPLPEARYQAQLASDGTPEVLGRGGYGKVLLVKDVALGRDAAMKRLSTRIATSGKAAQAEARLLREARVISQLDHPAVVPLYDLGRTPAGQLFYTMRRIRGRTLQEAVKAATSLEERLRLLPHVLAACHAVAYAHSRGILHRDLKPQNVMVDRFGETYLIDWGLATARDRSDEDLPPDSSGALELVGDGETLSDGKGRVGTPAYMSPEQLTGVRGLIDERSDVFGLGAILYSVLTGRAPRDTGPLERPVRPVRELEPRCPSDLAALCDKAMAASRDDRYASAEALATDLDAWLHGRPVTAHAYHLGELLRRFTREHRVPLAVGAVALVLLVMLGAASLVRLRDERDRARTFGLAMLEEALPRLRATKDHAFLTRFAGLAQEWLEAQGTDADDLPLARAWSDLARMTWLAQDYARARAYSQRCLLLTPGVPEPYRYALTLICGSTFHDSAPESTTFAERMEALLELERLEPPPAPPELEHVLIRGRFGVLSALFYYASHLGRTEDEHRFATAMLAAVDRWRALQPKEVEALSAAMFAYTSASVSASNRGDEPASLEATLKASTIAREALALGRDEPRLQSYANALTQEAEVRRWFVPEDAAGREALEREGLRVFDALLLFRPGAAPVVLDLADFHFQLGNVARAGELAGQVAFGDALGEERYAWAVLNLVGGHARRVTEQDERLRETEGLDAPLYLALAWLEVGDVTRARRALATARARPATTSWVLGGLEAWAKQLPGARGEAARRFEAAMTAAQRKTDDAGIAAALARLDEDLAALEGP